MKLSQKTTDNLERLQASLDQARSQGAELAAVRSMALASALWKIGEYQKGQAGQPDPKTQRT